MLAFLQIQNSESEPLDSAEVKAFIQAHVPGAHLKEAQGGDMVYSLPPFTSSSASSYRSLLTALDANLDDLQLGGYGISDTTLEEVNLYSPNLKSFDYNYCHFYYSVHQCLTFANIAAILTKLGFVSI